MMMLRAITIIITSSFASRTSQSSTHCPPPPNPPCIIPLLLPLCVLPSTACSTARATFMSALIASLPPLHPSGNSRISLQSSNSSAQQQPPLLQQQQTVALLHHLLDRTRHIDCAAALLYDRGVQGSIFGLRILRCSDAIAGASYGF